ncbi:hypothetical protein [Photobacterium nomapromontoriensis]|uniref:hypothetical protein n=1 Tax=Photobacterium nomapromontoriensis TaxID=2910237 RepID=UPI003D140B34
MDVEAILNGLNDPRVKAKIIAIVHAEPQSKEVSDVFNTPQIELQDPDTRLGEEDAQWQAQITQLHTQLNVQQSELVEKDKIIETLTTQIHVAQQEMAQVQVLSLDAEKMLAFYRDNFDEELHIQVLYQQLSEQTQSSLSGIFKETSLKGLMVCGVQEKNITNLWDYAKNAVVNGNHEDAADIVALFTALFTRFVLAYPMYQWQPVEIGEEFNTQAHIRHNSSEQMSGCIEAVILPGYVNVKTGMVMKPSVVKI